MGNDPKTSVVNRDCQLHDVDNIYVVDASVHVTNGRIQSGAHHPRERLSRLFHLLRTWKGSKVRA
ncbi:MAG: GMC oxidoreductase [Ignavibacteriota bacterium]